MCVCVCILLVGLICNSYIPMQEVKNVKPNLFLSPPVDVSGRLSAPPAALTATKSLYTIVQEAG